MLDIPIRSDGEDEFGHVAIANYLCTFISQPRTNDGLIVALTGAWGTGKSGILNLVCDKLPKRTIRFASDDRETEVNPSVFQFQPWLVGSRDALIGSFFAELLREIDRVEEQAISEGLAERDELRRVSRLLKQHLSKIATLASAAADASSFVEPTGQMAWVASALSFVGRIAQTATEESRSLERERKLVEESLARLSELRGGLRFVVIVDDIDRLEPNEVVELFRLFKAVADFPYLTYVLAFDQPVVEQAIEKALCIDSGGAFLEKLVQFIVPVPPLSPRALPRWLERKLQEAFPAGKDLASGSSGELDFGSQRATIVLRAWSARLLETPRDVKRLVASIQFIWSELRGKADLLDLVWIEMLKVKASSRDADLYSWVRDYMGAVEEISFGAQAVGVSEQAKHLDLILKRLGWKAGNFGSKSTDPADLHHLQTMLPGVANSYLEESKSTGIYAFSSPPEWEKFIPERRLGSPRHWQLYFALQPPPTAVFAGGTQGLIQAAAAGRDALIEYVSRLLDSSSTVNKTEQILFEWLEPNIDSLDAQSAWLWLQAIAELAELFNLHSVAAITPDRTSFAIRQRRLIARLFRRFPVEGRIARFEELAWIAKSLWSVSDFFRGELRLHSRREERSSTFDVESVFQAAGLDRAREVLFTRLRQMSWDELERSFEPWTILFAWRDAGDVEAAGEWMTDKLSNNETLVPRLEKFVTYSWSDVAIPHLKAAYLRIFTSDELIKQRLTMLVVGDHAHAKRAQHLVDIWDLESLDGPQTAKSIADILLEWEWEFVFNAPRHSQTGGTSGSKRMTFEENGKVVEGRNNNEDRWRISKEVFEFLNSDGEIYSRFKFDRDKLRFDHTNDADTKSLRNQFMTAKAKRSGQ